ncbi:hypothetical protein A9Q81_06035 [Gammaproteobacteria bacterium 42_54_T18]|nr:hypothetical protein A9Q81_06035 [Gammaproteobacteria bacterium 42_54_T18]
MNKITSQSRFIVQLNLVDLVTLTGVLLIAGVIALTLAEQFEYALGLLYLALLADGIDGPLARKYGTTREFGRYLDGFVDVFDYLVAPTLFLYVWGFDAWYQCLIMVLFVICGIIRLAVFNEEGNIEDEGGLGYLGMPVFWSSLCLGLVYLISFVIGKTAVFWLLTVVLPVYSVLMVYNRRFWKPQNMKVMLGVLIVGALLFFVLGSTGGQIYNHLWTALLAIIPLVIGGIIHMIVVTKDLFSFLKIPINTRLFGANKTLRGFVVMPLASIPGVYLIHWLAEVRGDALTMELFSIPAWWLGVLLGLAYAAAEIPNSFIKRRMGVAPGETPQRFKLFFVIADQLDSTIGCLLVYVFLLQMPMLTLASTFVIAPVIALLVKQVLFVLGLKSTRR